MGERTEKRAQKVARRFEIPVLIAALLVVPTIIIEQSSIGDPWSTIAYWMNWLIWIVFLLEVVVMLLVVPSKKKWLLRHPLEVAIVVLSPPFMPASLQSTRMLRLLRLVRLLRVAKLVRDIFSVRGLYLAAFTSLLIVLAGGAAFTIVEKNQNLSPWDGMYWAMTTVTTVGSDINPATDIGRIIALVVLFVGTGFVAMLTAAVAEQFISHKKRDPNKKTADAEVIKRLDDIAERLDRLEKRGKK